MRDWMNKRRVRILGIGLALAAASTVAAFGFLQAITPADAEQIALDQYPGATVTSTQLEDENGTPAYSVELQAASGDVEVTVDSSSGAVLATDSENEGADSGSGDVLAADSENEGPDTDSNKDGDQIENEQEGNFETED